MNKIACVLVVLAGVISGCASVSVSGDALQSRTVSSLGIPADSFTISDRKDSGIRTDFTVTTKANKVYACYVTGTVGVVSDAICTAMTQAGSVATSPAPKAAASSSSSQAPKASTGGSTSNCNALLKAAGKC